MENRYKVLIAHPAQQHSFRTAVALKNSGNLFKYITTVYDKENSITSFAKKFLKGDNLKRANTRKSEELCDNDVIQYCEFSALLLLLLQRIDKSKVLYNILDNIIVYRFNKKVAKYAIKNDVDIIIMYDTLCYKSFEIIKKKNPSIKRVIDMSAPNFVYMDKIFREDISKNGKYSNILNKEIESSRYKKILKNSLKEIKLANYFLVASSFSKISLEYSGIKKDTIFKCAYGIDTNLYKYKNRDIKESKKINCIFIGNVTQKKGVFYFFNAISKLDKSKFSFKIIGAYDSSSEYYKDFKDICDFTGHITKDKLIKVCQEADVIVFPSLADGFGLSVLESLSCGVPAICSRNAGVSDLIVDGYNGFIIPYGDEKSIYDKLIWISENREDLKIMSKNARETAINQTWNNYNNNIKNAIISIENRTITR